MSVKVLLPEEAREILKVGKSKMQELLNSDDFPSYKVGRRWYVNALRLEEWINKKSN